MIRYLNKNLSKHILNDKDNKKYCLKRLLLSTHKVVWDGKDGKLVMIIPHNKLFGRLILDISNPQDIKIVCNDYRPSYEKYSINKDCIKEHVRNLYDGNYIRMYYVKDEWHFATCNVINAKKAVYKTNKNSSIITSSESFYALTIKFFENKKYDFTKFDKSKTHLFLLNSTLIFNTYKVDESALYLLGSFSNKEEYKFKKIEKNYKLNIVGTAVKLVDGKQIILRNEYYEYIKQLCHNFPNVYYIILVNLTREEEFKKVFPYWYKKFKEVKKTIHSYTVRLLKLYRTGVKSNKKVFDQIMLTRIHELYLLKKYINYTDVFNIIIHYPPSFLSVAFGANKYWIS